jgi:hypothetical protein
LAVPHVKTKKYEQRGMLKAWFGQLIYRWAAQLQFMLNASG